jgi:hypothetical protein
LSDTPKLLTIIQKLCNVILKQRTESLGASDVSHEPPGREAGQVNQVR